MTDSSTPDPLLEWNRLNRENAENAIVSSMFEASTEAIEPVASSVTWMLAGTGAIASFLLANAETLLPILGQSGFLWCGLTLAASAFFGIIAKVCLLSAEIGRRVGHAVADSVNRQLAIHEVDEEKIQAAADLRGVEIETGIRMDRILTEFLAPMPWYVRLYASRSLKRHGSNPQIAYISRVKAFNSATFASFLQSMAFLAFMLVGFVSSAT
jgi:hypothetical protein